MRCPKCLGARRVRKTAYDWTLCDACDGEGTVTHRVAVQYLIDHPNSQIARRIFEAETKVPCVDCEGTGRVTAVTAAEQRARKKQ